MRRFLLITVSLLALVTPIPSKADLSLAGSTTIHPIVKLASEHFYHKTGIRVHSIGGGTEKGIQLLLDKQIDISMASRQIGPSDPKELVYYTIGHDGIAVIVNTINPLSKLSHKQVAEIFSGKISNWKMLGGRDHKIIPIIKRRAHSTKKLFESFFSLQGKTPKSARVIGSNLEDIMYVAIDPYAIGYVSIGSAASAHNHGVHIKSIALDGIQATMASIAKDQYPLQRPLNLITVGKPQPKAKKFIQFLLGPEGQQIVRQEGFIPASHVKKDQQ
ncbi:phosphate ABC transporter substrate-binding protein [Magnetococcales bacterium HHB-1]